MNSELYHKALGALWKAYFQEYTVEGPTAPMCERIFVEMILELDKRGLEIVEKQ